MFFSQRGKVFRYDVDKHEVTLHPDNKQLQLMDFF